MLSLIFRTVGAWGAGKGSNLTPDEVDENFFAVQESVNALLDNPALPVEIASISTTDNFMTVHMSDGTTSFGPFALPTASFNFREDWTPVTAYKRADLFVVEDGLYYVNRPFTSGSDFIPGEGAGVGGTLPYASFVMPIPNKVRVAWYWPGRPGVGLPTDLMTSSDLFIPMFVYLTADPFYLSPDLPGARATLRGEPAADLTFEIYRNEVLIGTLLFTAGTKTGVFTFTNSVDFADGDALELVGPGTPDDTAFGLSVTMVGRLGEAGASSS